MSRNVSKTVSGIFYCCLRSYLDRAHWFFRGEFSDRAGGGGLLSTEVDKKGCEKKALFVTVRCCRASTEEGMLQRHQLQQGRCRGTNCNKGVAGAPTLQRFCRWINNAEMLHVYQNCRDVAGGPTLQKCCRCTNNAEKLKVQQLRWRCCRGNVAGMLQGRQLWLGCCTNFARDVANEKALVTEVLQMRKHLCQTCQMRREYLRPRCGKRAFFLVFSLLSFLTGNAPIILYRTRTYKYGTCAEQVCTLFSLTVNPWESYGSRVY